MDPARILKLGAVFVAGVCISVGGSLLYFLAQDRTQTAPVAPVSRPATVPQRPPVTRPDAPLTPAAPLTELAKAEDPKPAQDSGSIVNSSPAPVSKPLPARKKSYGSQSDPLATRPPETTRAEVVKSTESKITDSVDGGDATTPVSSQPAATDRHRETVPAPKPQIMTLPSGTYLVVRLGETLSTKQNNPGDPFRGTLDSALMVNGLIVAERGSPVIGQIVTAREAGLAGGSSELVLRLTQINTGSGQIIPVETNFWERQGARGGIAHSAKKAGGAVVGMFTGAISGAAKAAGMSSSLDNTTTDKGKPANQKTVVVSKDTELTFNLATPVTITEKLASR